ncbi:MAG: DUF1674 domain-containing protein [Lysobacteraceae bacterium]
MSPQPPSLGHLPASTVPDAPGAPASGDTVPAVEVGGRDGPEPTRYGDWEKNGRCIDF